MRGAGPNRTLWASKTTFQRDASASQESTCKSDGCNSYRFSGPTDVTTTSGTVWPLSLACNTLSTR